MFNVDKYKEINEILKKHSNSGKIIAISKNHPVESVLEAINQGVYIFGENRVQEANKFLQLNKIIQRELHLTAPYSLIKSECHSLFDVFHTLDREKIAKEFSTPDLLGIKNFLYK